MHHHTTQHTQVLDQVVDVMCSQCQQLIPFDEVNRHSLECAKDTNLNNAVFGDEFEHQVRDINSQVKKIQLAIGKRVLLLEEQKEELDEILSRDARQSHSSAAQRSSQESQALEYFLDQFSSLFAIC